jgi:hypothetical protein
MSEPTRVYFTVDVECSEERLVGSRLQPAMGYDLRIWGRFANRKSPLGIERIMNELEACGFRGTFYTEAIGAASFGMDGLRKVCTQLVDRGHDVQLHLHPNLREPNWHSEKATQPDDNIASYSRETQVQLLQEGIDILAEAGVPRDDLLSYRAGNFGASNETWHAMSEAGLVLSSNYNPFYCDKDCKIDYPEGGSDLFATPAKQVWELPISNFLQPNGGFRHLQITATSLEEMKEALWQSRRLGIGHVTFVTHSFEFCCIDSPEDKLGHPNHVNLHRLRGLLRFLRDNPDDFMVDTAGALAKRLQKEGEQTILSGHQGYPQEKKRHYYRRLIEQGIKRIGTRITI